MTGSEAESPLEPESREEIAHVANRKNRQAFLTRIMEDESLDIRDRLRASELLARSEGDFPTRAKNEGSIGISAILEWASRKRAAEAALAAEDAIAAKAKEKEAAGTEEGVEGFGMAGLSQVGRWNQPAEETKLPQPLEKSGGNAESG
ncbi:MAG: hypothetical protein LBU23_11945 [Planctomycetota bacterium]|jgi:hypothetical protein|nr:hypothetical protein [Planctomycetota bacterium]